MTTDEAFSARAESYARHISAPYVQFLKRMGLDLDFVRAAGAEVHAVGGRRFIDCVAGYGNLNLGHNHPDVIRAVVDEITSARPFNLPFLSDAQTRLAEELARVSPGDLECSLIVNSGAEAVDSALKLARLSTGRPGIIATRGGFHGFTYGALSVSEPALVRGFGPLLPGVTHVAYGDADAISQALTPETGAVIVEPIQSEAGCIIPPPGYLRQVADICAARGVVLIFDEVKTGVAKTGRFFACEYDNAVPDLLLVGKSLGGGAMPIGAVIGRRSVWGKLGLSFPMSASSGSGNAAACAAGVASIAVVERERLAEQAAAKGERVLATFRALAADFPGVVTAAAGRGLLCAIACANLKVSSAIVAACIRRGVLLMVAFCDRSRILFEPPLAIADALLDEALFQVREAVSEVAGAKP